MRPKKEISQIPINRTSKLLQAELAISYMLRYGVLLCAAIIALGLALRFLFPSEAGDSSQQLVQNIVQSKILTSYQVMSSFAAFKAGLWALNPDTVIALGLLCLIALPVLRVGMTVILFTIEQDFIYVAITLWVFSVLITGFFMGKAL